MVGSKVAAQAGQGLDYEEQRLARIAENKKRMEVSFQSQRVPKIFDNYRIMTLNI
jgi:hypothetical protein